MQEKIESLIEDATIRVNGKVMYKGEIIKKIIALGVYLHFSDDGVRYKFNEE